MADGVVFELLSAWFKTSKTWPCGAWEDDVVGTATGVTAVLAALLLLKVENGVGGVPVDGPRLRPMAVMLCMSA